MSAVLHLCNIQSLLCTSHRALLRKAASINLHPTSTTVSYKVIIEHRVFSYLYSNSVPKTGTLVLSKNKFEKVIWHHKPRAFKTSIFAELITSQSFLRNNSKFRRKLCQNLNAVIYDTEKSTRNTSKYYIKYLWNRINLKEH